MPSIEIIIHLNPIQIYIPPQQPVVQLPAHAQQKFVTPLILQDALVWLLSIIYGRDLYGTYTSTKRGEQSV